MSGTNGAASLQNAPFATPKHHATEGRNDLQKHAAPEVVLQASKTHPSPHRNTMLLKDGTTSKNILPRGLTSLLDSGKNKASSAAGPAAAAAGGAAAGAGAAGLAAAAAPATPFVQKGIFKRQSPKIEWQSPWQ